MSSRTSLAKLSSFCPQMSKYSCRELASPQNAYQTETLRGLAMSGSRYRSTSDWSAATGLDLSLATGSSTCSSNSAARNSKDATSIAALELK